MADKDQRERLQAWLEVSPFQRWLGMEVEDAGDGRLVLGLPWRDEFVSNPHPPTMHGGVIASLIDLGGFYAVLAAGASAAATVDIAVDYHSPVSQERVRSVSEVTKLGSKVASAATRLLGEDGRLVASGRGVYLLRGQPSGR